MSILYSINFYPCSSIKATDYFYRSILGLSLYNDQGSAKIYDTGYGYWGFVEYGDRDPNPSGLCLSLNCVDEEDVDKYYQLMVSKGVKIISPPARHPKFPVYSFFIQDPDGYLIEFQKILSV